MGVKMNATRDHEGLHTAIDGRGEHQEPEDGGDSDNHLNEARNDDIDDAADESRLQAPGRSPAAIVMATAPNPMRSVGRDAVEDARPHVSPAAVGSEEVVRY